MSAHTTSRTRPTEQQAPKKVDSAAKKLLRDLSRRDAEKAREDALVSALHMGILGR